VRSHEKHRSQKIERIREVVAHFCKVAMNPQQSLKLILHMHESCKGILERAGHEVGQRIVGPARGNFNGGFLGRHFGDYR
jgi:hypothetical protein